MSGDMVANTQQSGAGMDLYLYYRVPSGAAAELRRRVEAMQASLAADPGVATALKKRPGEKDGMQTWMEIYLAVPDGFEAALDQAVAHAGLSSLIASERHTERFVDITPCA
jgi:Domain of unknown function (DUF4936)